MGVNSGSQLSFYIQPRPTEVKKTGTTSPLSCLLFHGEVASIMLVTRNIVVITFADATLIPASPVLSVGPQFDFGNRGWNMVRIGNRLQEKDAVSCSQLHY
jgi:hypothetical protein